MNMPSRPLKDLFLLALDVAPGDRADWLDRECAGNSDLRQQLQLMLTAHDAPHSLLDRPAVGAIDSAGRPIGHQSHCQQPVVQRPDSQPPLTEFTIPAGFVAEPPGTPIGPYKLLQKIGEGGMGVVYMAEQTEPVRRKVALKIIKPGLDTRQVITRFEAERQALSLMEHPNIAAVFDAGATATGRPYFVMELVKGQPITDYCDQRQLSPRQRLELFLPVCHAIQHAHQKGVIHRDIKPANILVAEYDGRPVAKVIDFGVAKAVGQPLTEKTLFTEFGQIVGTLEYMSPEQARVNQLDVDTRTDVYSLGVLLYELLTGSTPFDRQRLRSSAWDEILRIIREEEPPKPSTRLSESTDALPSISARRHAEPAQLTQMIRGDLDWIVMKALEKERGRRYETANALARDIERHLADELIEACPPSTVYHLRKFARQHRAGLMTASIVLACLVAGTAVSAGLAVRARRAENVAVVYARAARFAQVQADERRAETEQKRKEVEEQRGEAERQRAEAQSQRDDAEHQRVVAQAEKLAAQQNLVTSQLLLGKAAHTNGDAAAALTWYLQAYRNAPSDDPRRVSARNLIGAGGGGLHQTLVHDSGVHTIAVSADGRKLVSGYYNSRAQIWDLATGMPDGTPLRHSGDIVSAQLSADGSIALIGDWEGAVVWDLATGKRRYPTLDHEVREDTVVGPVLSPDNRTIVTRSPFTGIRLWDVETGEPRGESLPQGKFVYRMHFSPDSQRVVALSGDLARVWNVANAEPAGEPWQGATDLAFHPAKGVIAVSHNDGKLILHDLEAGRRIAELPHDQPLESVQFDASGRNLVARGGENAYLWVDVLDDQRKQRVLPHGRQLATATISANGEWVLTAGPLLLRMWKVGADSPQWERSVPPNLSRWRSERIKVAELSPDGASLLTLTESDTVELLSAATGQSLFREANVLQAKFAADGRTLFLGSRDGWVRVRTIDVNDPRRRSRPLTGEVCSGSVAALSPDEKTIFVVGRKQSGLYRTDSWELIGKPLVGLHHDFKDAVAGAAFSPDSRLLITAMSVGAPRKPGQMPGPSTGHVSFWDATTGELVGDPITGGSQTLGVAFDSTGQNALVGDRVIDVRRRVVRTFPPDRVPAGHRTVVQLFRGPGSPTPRLWDDDADRPTSIAMPVDKPKQAMLAHDGRRLLIVRDDGVAQLFDVAAGTPVGPEFRPAGIARENSGNGRYTLFVAHNFVRIWDAQTGRPCGDNLLEESASVQTAFSPDGTRLVTFWHFTAQMWDCATGTRLGPPMLMPSNSSGRPIFSADGRTLYVPSNGLEVWRVHPPATDDLERVRLSIEVRTGLELDEDASIRKLSQASWLDRKRRLEERGGPCDIVVEADERPRPAH